MGRGKIEVKRIENNTSRQVTFSKRRAGLMKKTHELSVLCDAQIGLIVFSSRGKLTEYCTPQLSMKQMIDRYAQAKGISIPDRNNRTGPAPYNDQMYKELTQMQRQTLNLQVTLQRYKGDDLSSVQYEELRQLEQQLEHSVDKVRARKFQLLHEQLENLKKTELLLEKENQEMYHWLMSSQIQKQAEIEHHQEAMKELRLIEQHPLLNQFPFFGEDVDQEQPSSVLQLATLQPPHSRRLQPTHPNLQDFGTSFDNYGAT
ncbi:MADS-box protein defh21-like [Primulina eburnea]|uniref:MADS-box protein defh21-like n=1 Tax=Primulina eburnea TaxID=1245227 RepID=UPI003C6C0EDB